MALAQRASPAPSDGSAQGDEDVRAGYLEQMDDPPAPCLPVRYAGDYGRFSTPSAGSPLRGEAVSYLASWASRLAAAAETASAAIEASGGKKGEFPQPVWRLDGGAFAWLRDAFPRVSAADPRLDVFRLRLLDFLRLRRSPVGIACDETPPEPVSRFADWSWTTTATTAMMQDEDPKVPPEELEGEPVFAEGYLLAASQGAVDANGGRWLVPCPDGAEGLPFGADGPEPSGAGPRPAGDTGPRRAALAYMASLSRGQGDPDLRDGGFAARYVPPPMVRPPDGGARVPDPDFVQEPEPVRASGVRALFGDALESGRSRVWAGCASLNLFAALDLRTDPAVTETRWRYHGTLNYAWRDVRGAYPDVATGDLPFTYDFGPDDPAEVDRATFRAETGDGGVVALRYVRSGATWTAAYSPDGGATSSRPEMAVSYQSPNLDSLSSGTAVLDPTSAAYYGDGCRCSFAITWREPYEHVVEPARTHPVWGSSALPHAASFRFRSVARLEETDPDEWYGAHPGPSDATVLDWFRREFVDPSDEYVEFVSAGIGGVSGGPYGYSFVGLEEMHALYAADTGGEPPPDPYTGRVQRASSVGLVRDAESPHGLAQETEAGLPDRWWLGSRSMWIVDAGGGGSDWDELHAGINWAKHEAEPGVYEYAPSGAPADGGGRFDLEYVASAPAAGGAASPLCPGGIPVPVQSADSVAVFPLFCAEVAVTVKTRRSLSWKEHPFDLVAQASYERDMFGTPLETEVRTHYVVGFADGPCSWTRDAGEESAGSSARYALSGGAGPDALWDFVRRRVLAPLRIQSAEDLLYGSDVTYALHSTPMGPSSGPGADLYPIPHDAYAVSWERWENGSLVEHDPPPRHVAGEWVLSGDAAEWAEVSGTVEFPFCVYESGYCA